MENSDLCNLRDDLAKRRKRIRGWSLYPRISSRYDRARPLPLPASNPQAAIASSPVPVPAPTELPGAEYVPLDDPFVTPIGASRARRKTSLTPLIADGSERRRLPRKATLMAGVIA